VFQSYGLTAEESTLIVDALRKRPQAWVDFMMRFELGLEKTNPRRAVISAVTIAGAYIAGGFIPFGPYVVFSRASTALTVSAVTHAYRPGRFRLHQGLLHWSATVP
jgi:vacuolar iron transporter family protein